MQEKQQIVIKEDWKGDAIQAILKKIGYGIGEKTAGEMIKLIIDSTTKIEIKNK